MFPQPVRVERKFVDRFWAERHSEVGDKTGCVNLKSARIWGYFVIGFPKHPKYEDVYPLESLS